MVRVSLSVLIKLVRFSVKGVWAMRPRGVRAWMVFWQRVSGFGITLLVRKHFHCLERKLVKENREEICMVEAEKDSCRVIIIGEDLRISA